MTPGATALAFLFSGLTTTKKTSIKGKKRIFVARVDSSLKQKYFQQKLIISIRILSLLLFSLLYYS